MLSARRVVASRQLRSLLPPCRRSVSMKGSNRLQNVLAEGKRPSMGLWQMLPGANVSRVLASAGVDWVMIDCEHGNLDGRTTPPLLRYSTQILTISLRQSNARICPGDCGDGCLAYRAHTRRAALDGQACAAAYLLAMGMSTDCFTGALDAGAHGVGDLFYTKMGCF